ncbi:MAG TPA: metalloregulator ArsR/SmtB family transcription factor, partial [Longimicrobiales bacterium]|nr:metalloregulator ArsR/SmtB family transcription factor [Longimicrobiales bacterium]
MSSAPPVFDHLATLGDTTRSRLLALLEEREFTVTELRRILQLPQSTVSGHLKVLSDAGWTTSRADGKNRFYRMSPALDEDARSLWALIREDMEGAGFRIGDRERARSILSARVDRSRAFFSESAECWEDVRAGLYGPAVAWLPLFGLLEPEWVVADLGCGTGQLAAAVAPFTR